jgi:hypothetical protein
MLKTIFTVFCISSAIMMSVFVYACHDEKKATSKVIIKRRFMPPFLIVYQQFHAYLNDKKILIKLH